MRLVSFTTAACLAALLAACSGPDTAVDESGAQDAISASDEAAAGAGGDSLAETGPAEGSLEWAVAGEWRTEQAARDVWRHPQETLTLFEIDPASTVMEIWPAGGWYTQILAPWIAANGGRYVAAYFPTNGDSDLQAFRDAYLERFSAPVFGTIEMADFGPETGPIMEAGSVDAVLTFRNVHNWMARGFAEKAFDDFFAVLRPGGVLGVVEHRLPASMEQDPRAASGYVQQDYVIALAREAGFELVTASEINANPADTADHPFGVWTLPPVSRTPSGQTVDPDFDPAVYAAVGESDRMTLLFRKPVETAAETQAEPEPQD